MNRSEQIDALAGALAKAQAIIKNAPKDNTAKAGAYSYNYATLAGTWEACRKALTDNGLSVAQPVETDGPAVRVTTILLHASGQWISETLTMVAKDSMPQSIGSAITYGRRYGFGAMVGVATEEDDDGATAQQGKATNGDDKHAKAAALTEEFRKELHAAWKAKDVEAFKGACDKAKGAKDHGWLYAKQIDELRELMAKIQVELMPQPAQAAR